MHLGGAGVEEHRDELAGRVPADDRVVDDDDALALHLAERVELHPDALLAHALLGLDERPRDVAVLDERLVVRDPGGLREADRRGRSAVGDADHEIRLGRCLLREPLAHAHARTVHLDAADTRVGACEVDVLEDAQSVASGRHGLGRVQPLLVDPDDLARPHVADDVGTDEIEGARLGGDDPVLADLAERQRAKPERVTERDERPVDERGDRVRAFEPLHRRCDSFGERRSGLAR